LAKGKNPAPLGKGRKCELSEVDRKKTGGIVAL
jgi:hypothetical protein